MIDISKLVVTAPFNAGANTHGYLEDRGVVDVLKRDGGIKRVAWYGFMPIEWARAVEDAKPVKVIIYGYDTATETHYIKRGKEFLQGCYIDGKVWGVIEDGKPKIIKQDV